MTTTRTWLHKTARFCLKSRCSIVRRHPLKKKPRVSSPEMVPWCVSSPQRMTPRAAKINVFNWAPGSGRNRPTVEMREVGAPWGGTRTVICANKTLTFLDHNYVAWGCHLRKRRKEGTPHAISISRRENTLAAVPSHAILQRYLSCWLREKRMHKESRLLTASARKTRTSTGNTDSVHLFQSWAPLWHKAHTCGTWFYLQVHTTRANMARMGSFWTLDHDCRIVKSIPVKETGTL